MAYDQAKAEAYNKARAQGLSQADALNAAGIGPTERFSYATGPGGQIGPREQIVANLGRAQGTVTQPAVASPTDSQGRPVEVLTGDAAARARAEEAAFQATGAVPSTPYAQTASPAPGVIRTREYTETSTTSISGGGSTTIVATPSQPTAASRALDAQAQQTQREIEALQLANSGFGPGPQLSEEQQAANDARILQLQQQYNAQRDAAEAAKAPNPPSITTVPNTTTNVNTVTFERSVEVGPVSNNDPAQISRSVLVAEAEGTGEAIAAVEPTNVDPAVDETLRTPDGLVEEGEQAETGLAEPDDVDLTQDETLRTPDGLVEEGEQAETGLAEPADVDAEQDPGLRTPDGEEEGGEAAETGLREPTDEDVAAAEAATKLRAKNQATLQSRYKQPGNTDWRVRLLLAPSSDYLYNASPPGILAPLQATNGVIFPYTPTVTVNYQANYEQYDLVHSNYRGLYYKNSRVGDVSIRGVFTAQDTTEASYLLAVIHFFRSVTKMFYGQDAERGTPPPLVYLNGFGDYQFSNHPCVVGQFNYTLPSDVDYIRANNPNNYGENLLNRRAPTASAPGGMQAAGLRRLANALLPKGATPKPPDPGTVPQSVNNTALSTYVPTKIEIDITLIPVQTRSQVSKQFSLKNFANGEGLKGGFW